MEDKVYKGTFKCSICGGEHSYVDINDDTVIKEFSANYYLHKSRCAYSEEDRFCVLVRYSDFMNNPDMFIDKAFDKLSQPIANEVHWRDLRE